MTLTPSKSLLAVLGMLLFSPVGAAGAADDGFNPSMAPDAPVHEEVMSLPGDPANPVMLQVTLLTPSGRGPFPLAVLNHGANGSVPTAQQPRYRQGLPIYYFLSRGYAVVLPMMRGYAGSGGGLRRHGCQFDSTALDDARDIRAVIEAVTRRLLIDGTRIVVAGQSFGGLNSLAVGTLAIPGVRGVVNFSGGLKSSDCPDGQATLAAAAGRLGGRATVPSIWFYGDNDRLFPPAVWRAMYARYTAAGGQAELVAFGSFMTDAHGMAQYAEGLRIWPARVDAFLARLGLPGKAVYPEYLPMAFPPASHYAALNDIDAVPYIGDHGRDLYRQFMKEPLPRAFAIGSNGSATWATGGFDPLTRALQACNRGQVRDCRLYAVDDDVVWTRPTPAPPPTHFAALADAAAIPYIDARGRDAYRQFLTSRRPRAFVIAPDGGWAGASGGADPLAGALDACGKQHRGCRLYAVDDDVLWSGR